ncbi:photosystem II biogenesis protein Psp29 [Prochlorococcus marinus]|uniref:Protein Thf1 n=1 Tax=Prochlorococcus marinus XMU1408 TaxID=2213228 RepID=A0A318R6Y9_PROMR|nr:photosystem II biogenesis protein Psp29 [Prochlorococcus marinus]MBW3041920.1 photosystem II biogenesis protein Psp29 [Prochlorococcus marinus str. XMU1408]PYE03292.1 photosystem II biogenesis protein Psp29 [Prochlorococcus marinus XMU1408]
MSVRATISDSKSDFHKEFPYVIPPIYRKLADELLVELHLLSHQKNFNNNKLFATGLKEIFNKFTSGYKPTEHIEELFNAICNCNGFNPTEISKMSEELIREANLLEKENLSKFLSKLENYTKESDYYSRINAIGIYKLATELSYCKDINAEELNNEIINITDSLGYQYSRVEKDISMYKSNIEKMKQALEIIALNLSSNKK